MSSIRGDTILFELNLFGGHIQTFRGMLTDDELREYYRYCNKFISKAQEIQKEIIAVHERNKDKSKPK